MFKAVDDFYQIKKGQIARLTANDGDGVFTGTVENPETDLVLATIGGVEMEWPFKDDFKIEVEDPPVVLPTAVGSVIRTDDHGYLVLDSDDYWGNADYSIEVDEFVDEAYTFAVVFVNEPEF